MAYEHQPAGEATCEEAQLGRDDAAPRLVGEVMVRRPKTLPGAATVGEVRELFANPKVVSVLLVEGSRFVGVLERSDLPASACDAEPASTHARRDVVTTTPDALVQDALAVLDAGGADRLVVLADDGVTLAGLLCLDRPRAGFCTG